MGQHIKCNKTISLVRGYLSINNASGRGILHNNSLSILFINIILNQLDLLVGELKQKYKAGVKRAANPEYTRVLNELRILKKADKCPGEREYLEGLIRSIPRVNYSDPNFTRLLYLRYLDKVLLGVIGPRPLVSSVFYDLKGFMEGSLFLSLHSDNFNAVRGQTGVSFLNVQIRVPLTDNSNLIIKSRQGVVFESRFRPRVSIDINISEVFNKLHSDANVFLKYNNAGNWYFAPTPNMSMLNKSPGDIIKFYNAKVYGLINYYFFADNLESLRDVVYILKGSCTLTLIRRCGYDTEEEVYSKFGHSLSIGGSSIKFYIPRSYRRKSY